MIEIAAHVIKPNFETHWIRKTFKTDAAAQRWIDKTEDAGTLISVRFAEEA